MASQYEKRKAKTIVRDTGEGAEKPEDIVWTGQAFDIVFDREARRYMKVTVNYNAETNQAEVLEVKSVADSQPVAVQKMQELFTKKILGVK